jgi:hypothetical protein
LDHLAGIDQPLNDLSADPETQIALNPGRNGSGEGPFHGRCPLHRHNSHQRVSRSGIRIGLVTAGDKKERGSKDRRKSSRRYDSA